MKSSVFSALLYAVGITVASGLTGIAVDVQAPPAQGASTPTTTWYFYTVRWGFQDEFLDLFQRNHYPVLKARMDAGYYASIRTFQPRYHGDGRADWTFAVELVAREGAPGAPSEEDVIRKLYPDQVKFRREEQRRFELLDGHWDVPLTPIDFEARAKIAR